eukprot:gene8175-11060_t
MIDECSNLLWEGRVPIKMIIAIDEIATFYPPEPYYTVASRFSYLPVIAHDAIEHFKHSAIDFSSSIWFESNNMPLRSFLPIGVLFDLHVTEENKLDIWEIIIHLRNYPKILLLKCHDSEQAEKLLFQSIKQALYLLYGSTRIFNELNVVNQKLLWEGCTQRSRISFENAVFDLRPSINDAKLIPIRFVRKNFPTIQRPVSPFITVTTTIFENVTTKQSADDNNSNQVEKTLEYLYMEILPFLQPVYDYQSIKFLIHGIEIPLSAPVYEVWKLFSHADLFLYITVTEENVTNDKC